jgi:KipI family sensor histidine kinase inhibitor
VTDPPRIVPVGDCALSAVFGDAIDAATNARVRALDARLLESPFPGFREAIPAHCTLLVLYDPLECDHATALAAVQEAAAQARPAENERRRELRELSVAYGGEHGADLHAVAEACELTATQVVERHTAHELTAFMLGFSPGFAYLGLLPPELQRPRRAEPRERVPPGSVAIAGPFTAVYPSASAGGWHLIGRIAQPLFDPGADPPSLILPGDRVRFRAVDTLFPAAAPAPARETMLQEAVLEVLEPGLFTTVQDTGRHGRRRLGVAPAGALDLPALLAANRALGNLDGAAALECTLAGPTLRFLESREFAIAGADLGATLERSDLGAWPVPPGQAVRARAGNVLRFSERRTGVRAYVAIAGGIRTPEVLGSRSASLVGGFAGLAGRALRAGDFLAGGLPRPARGVPQSARPPESGPMTLRVVLGPQDEAFGAASCAAFLATEYTVSPSSDRAGWRLEGAALPQEGPGEIASEGMIPGCIQVPPWGRPIVMGPDGPTTGGYPKIATVISVDLPKLAQLVPGDSRVRFTAVSVDEAQALLRAAARP